MPLGTGYFYDREKKKYVKIFEHASDAVSNPARFRSEAVAHLNPVKNRDEIVLHVLEQGFIRIRDHRRYLGWQFYGDTKSALSTLKRYLKKNEFGMGSVVTFTDFETGREVIAQVPHFESANEETVWE